MVQIRKTQFIQTALLHLCPLVFSIPVALSLSPWTSVAFNAIAPLQVWFIALVFVWEFSGMIVEFLYSMPDIVVGGQTRREASFGAVLFAIFAISDIVAAIFIFERWYQFTDTSINLILTVLLIIGIGAFAFQARSIILFGERTKMLFLGKQ
jgi:hypothetical protein